MKKHLLLLLVTLLPILASAYDAEIDGVYYYFYTNTKKATVTKGDTEYTGHVTIPETVTYNDVTYSVTSIDYSAFSGCSGLTSVTIPNSVTYIGGNAFYDCSNLTEIHISDIAAWCEIEFGSNAFSPLQGYHLFLNDKEITDLVIPDGVTKIGLCAFRSFIGLTSVTIPGSITSLSEGAFSRCSGLTSVNMPEGLTTIGPYAFDYCTGLTSITIPSSVKEIGQYAFQNSSGLTSVSIGNSVTSIGNCAFYGCSGLTSVTIPNSVTSIGYEAFSGCSGLTSVTIGNSVTSIGKSTFYGCSSLTSTTIGNSVTSIGGSAFYNCSSLTSVTIPNSVTSIGESTFYGCSSLTSVTIPNSVTSIGKSAFSGCSSLAEVHLTDLAAWCEISFSGNDSNPLYYAHHLFMDGKEITDLVIPGSVTSIGGYAFYGCSCLTSLTIPNSVTSIGYQAFYGCSSLTDVICHATLPPSYAVFDVSVLEHSTLHVPAGCIKRYKDDYYWSKFSSIKPIYGLDNYANIDGIYYVFSENNAEVSYADEAYSGDVVIPESVTHNSKTYNVTSIGSAAFYDCSSLTSVTIGNSVTSIGNCAFSGCSGLTSVTIPNSVTEIGDYAFYNCSGLTDVYCYAERVPAADGTAFYSSPISSATLHVLEGSLEAYKATSPWSKFGTIVALTEDEIDGIKDIESLTPALSKGEGDWFTLDGKKLSKPQKGINILRYSDGTSRKVVVK